MRFPIPTLLFVLATAFVTVSPADSVAAPQLLDLAALDPERRFDFLEGDWSYTFDQGKGQTRYELVLGGKAVRETFGPSFFGQAEFVGASLFLYDEGEKRWAHNWIDSLGNVLTGAGGIGAYENSDLPAMIVELEHEGARLRHVWYDITPSRFETDLLVLGADEEWRLARHAPFTRKATKGEGR